MEARRQQVGVTKGGTDVVWHLKSPADKSEGDYSIAYVGWNPAGVFFLGEKRVGFDVNGGMVFLHQNNLNSVTVPTTFDGSRFDDILYYPWGQYWEGEGFVFAGMDHYWQDVLHNTPNRQYAFYEGRWLSPDPLAGDVTNPQSLNRYACVLGNPTTLTDPSGLDWCAPSTLIYLGSNGYAGIGGGTCVDDATYNANPKAYQGYTSVNSNAFASWYGAGGSFFLGWDPFGLIGIPVVDASNYGWIPWNGSGYPGPAWGWNTSAGTLVATSQLYTRWYWGRLLEYLGDAFVLLSQAQVIAMKAPNPFEGHTIQAPPPPPQTPTNPAWQRGAVYAGCVQNPEAYLPGAGKPSGDPGADAGRGPSTWYAPNKRGQIVPISPGPSESLDFFAGLGPNVKACAEFARQ